MVHGSQFKHTQSKTKTVFRSAGVECCGKQAYEPSGTEGMQAIAKSVEDMRPCEFWRRYVVGWTRGMLNTEGGKDILGWTKAGLAQ